MAKSFRKERMNETIKELLSELLIKKVKDPRVGFVTITAVNVAADYESANVYYSVLGEEDDKASSKAGLDSAKSFLRKTIGRALKLKNVPELRFVYDDTLDRSLAIEERLKEIHEDDGDRTKD